MKLYVSVVLITAFVLSACTTPGKRTAIGAGAGAAAGAAVGAVIGHQTGHKGKGAAIGAATGAVLGGTIGNMLDKQAKELAAIAETKRTDEGIVTTLKDNILFDTNSAILKPAAKSNIDQLSEIIKKYPEDKVTIVGHTDSRGSEEYNQQLSERRAKSVMAQMTIAGVPSSSLTALGAGEGQPVASNETEDGRAKNRRVELHITVEHAE